MNIYPIITVLLMLLIFVDAVCYMYHIAKWTYADAESRGMKARFWTIFVLGAQNSFGLLLYLLKREERNQPTSALIIAHKKKAIFYLCVLLVMTLLLIPMLFLVLNGTGL